MVHAGTPQPQNLPLARNVFSVEIKPVGVSVPAG
jgi:hypothetical protein